MECVTVERVQEVRRGEYEHKERDTTMSDKMKKQEEIDENADDMFTPEEWAELQRVAQEALDSAEKASKASQQTLRAYARILNEQRFSL